MMFVWMLEYHPIAMMHVWIGLRIYGRVSSEIVMSAMHRMCIVEISQIAIMIFLRSHTGSKTMVCMRKSWIDPRPRKMSDSDLTHARILIVPMRWSRQCGKHSTFSWVKNPTTESIIGVSFSRTSRRSVSLCRWIQPPDATMSWSIILLSFPISRREILYLSLDICIRSAVEYRRLSWL